MKAFRIYTVNNTEYTAKGYWGAGGKLYKDRIKFIHVNNYNTSLKIARKILNDTAEEAVAIEDLNNNVLVIVDKRGGRDILKIKTSYKTVNKRQAIIKAKQLIKTSGGATIEKEKGYYKVFSYK